MKFSVDFEGEKITFLLLIPHFTEKQNKLFLFLYQIYFFLGGGVVLDRKYNFMNIIVYY